MKRYLLIHCHAHYPRGNSSDWHSDYDTIEAAKSAGEALDRSSKKVVEIIDITAWEQGDEPEGWWLTTDSTEWVPSY